VEKKGSGQSESKKTSNPYCRGKPRSQTDQIQVVRSTRNNGSDKMRPFAGKELEDALWNKLDQVTENEEKIRRSGAREIMSRYEGGEDKAIRGFHKLKTTITCIRRIGKPCFKHQKSRTKGRGRLEDDGDTRRRKY